MLGIRKAAVPAALCALAFGGSAVAADDNGVGELGARGIVREARDAFGTAGSMHARMTGEGLPDGIPAAWDLRLDDRGRCTGRVWLKPGKAGVEVLRQGEDLWLRPDAEWLAVKFPGLPADVRKALLDGTYLHVPATHPAAAEVAQFCDLDALRGQMRQFPAPTAGTPLDKGGTATVDGTPVVDVSAEQGGTENHVYVATEGTPYPLRTTSTTDDGTMALTITMSEFDEPVTVKPPPAGRTIDLGVAPG
ncbi:hypothetical protein SRB5_23110 [Streptomyces sp. RB5]|uniref:Lipoprotein n=1 Tax=Streptomyces smaragdinus TaxID=2585196 RepID=A0A7K0CFC9_9ACTN|nr:hypothetical protein [Streptomyces smaragdinus]MQY12181.1 hypothetical protein [Streptomyces smaragdinus]